MSMRMKVPYTQQQYFAVKLFTDEILERSPSNEFF